MSHEETLNSDVSSNFSEEDCDSDGLGMGGLSLSSHTSSIGGYIDFDSACEEETLAGFNHKIANVENVSVPLHTNTLPETAKFFWSIAQQEPLYGAISEYRSKVIRGEIGQRRLETPSAAAAVFYADYRRLEFAKIVTAVGSKKQKNSWFTLSSEIADEFICHLFLPSKLGGLFDAQNGRK